MKFSLILILITFFSCGKSEPKTSESVKWNPGHYLLAFKKTTQQDFLKGNFLGVQKKYDWKDIEKSKGNYDFSIIKNDLSFLQQNNKRLFIELSTKAFGQDEIAAPNYLNEPEYNGGLYRTETGSLNPVFWNPKVEERLIALYTALGKEFDKELYVEGVNLDETAVSSSIQNGVAQSGVPTYSETAYVAALNRQMKALKDAFPHKVVIQYTNFPRTALKALTDFEVSNCIGIGGPDINPYAKGLNNPGGVYDYYEANKGRVPFGTAVQWEDYSFDKTRADGEIPDGVVPSVKSTYEFGRDHLHLNYIFWLDRPGYIDQVIEMMNSSSFPKDKAGGLQTTMPACLN